eukprot:6173605-Pleurochrysis_carterae.AAC.3
MAMSSAELGAFASVSAQLWNPERAPRLERRMASAEFWPAGEGEGSAAHSCPHRGLVPVACRAHRVEGAGGGGGGSTVQLSGARGGVVRSTPVLRGRVSRAGCLWRAEEGASTLKATARCATQEELNAAFGEADEDGSAGGCARVRARTRANTREHARTRVGTCTRKHSHA